MKKILYSVLSVAVVVLAASSCEKILDSNSPSAFDSATVYANYSLTEGTIFGITESFCEVNSYRGRFLPWYGHNTDIEWYNTYKKGDGKSDICYINENGTHMYTFDVTGNTMTARLVATYAELNKSVLTNKTLFLGEFNSDGLIDLLASPPSGSSYSNVWTLYNSKGNGQFESSTLSGPTMYSYMNFTTQDVNKDGKSIVNDTILLNDLIVSVANEMSDEQTVVGQIYNSDSVGNLKVGQVVESGANVAPELGNTLPLSAIPVGTLVHAIELRPGQGAAMARSAGTFAQLAAREGNYAILRLPSGETRMVPVACRATVGTVSNPDHNLESSGKAGRSRWLGRRPHNRGVVMNPHDHPMGGGEGRASGGHPRSRKGLPAKGKKTRNPKAVSNKFIIERRKK